MLSLHFVNVYPRRRKTSGLFHFAKELAAELAKYPTQGGVNGAAHAQGAEDRERPILAQQCAASVSPVRVSDVPVDEPRAWRDLLRFALDRKPSEVYVFQFSPHLFGRDQLAQFAALLLAYRVRGLPSVVVWHDANAIKDPQLGRAAAWSYAVLPRLVNATCVFSEGEAELFPTGAHVIPHFIRARPRLDRAEARRRLGLPTEAKIGGVLGFVHPRKGHDRTLELLSPNGPLDELVFAGECASEAYEERLRTEIERRGVRARVHFTGYLTDSDFALWANACDVGLCPFTDVSASGSLSDWLSLGRPVVANALPQLQFYADRAEASLRLVDTSDADAFRRTVAELVNSRWDASASDALLAELSVTAIASRHIAVARQAAARSGHGRLQRLRDACRRWLSPVPHTP